MKQITVDDETYSLAERHAARKGITVSEAVSDALRVEPDERPDPMETIGCIGDDADLLDQIVEEAMRDREMRPLRAAHE